MVRGEDCFLFQALNTGGAVRQNWEEWIFSLTKDGVHCFQTLKGGKFFSCLIDTHLIFVQTLTVWGGGEFCFIYHCKTFLINVIKGCFPEKNN